MAGLSEVQKGRTSFISHRLSSIKLQAQLVMHYVSVGSQATVMSNQRAPYPRRMASLYVTQALTVQGILLPIPAIGLISCIVWLEDRVVTASHTGRWPSSNPPTFCTSAIFLPLVLLTWENIQGWQGMRPVPYTAVYIPPGYIGNLVIKSPLKVQECCLMVTHLLWLGCLWMVYGEHHKACRRGRRQYEIITACERFHDCEPREGMIASCDPSRALPFQYNELALIAFSLTFAGRIQILTPATYNTDMIHTRSR